MKSSLRAILYGTGLLLAFGGGWWLKPAIAPDGSALPTPANADLPAKRPSAPTTQKPANVLAVPGGNWLEAAYADVAAVRAAMQPGVVNQVLIKKLNDTLNLSDKYQRLASWQGLLTEMQPVDALAVKELLNGWAKEGRWAAEEFRAFLYQWGSIDGATAAASAVGKGGNNAFMDEKIGVVLEGWCRRDADAAIAWLKMQGIDNVNPVAAISGSFQGLASMNFGAAEAWLLNNFAESPTTHFLAQPAMFKVQQEGLSAAGAWFTQIAGGDYPQAYKCENLNALIEAAQRLESMNAYKGPTTLDLLTPYKHEPWLPANAGQAMGKHWAENEPVTGMAEIQKMTSPEAKKAATMQLSQLWAASEPESFSVWLTENRSHPMFDQAAYQLTLSLKTTDPEGARAWAAQIKDPALKSDAAKPAPPDPFDPFASKQ